MTRTSSRSVTLDEQPDVRLTTNLVDIEPDDVRIGMPVEVVFEDHDPVLSAALPAGDVMTANSRAPGDHLRHRSVARSGRRLGRGDLDLTIDAALAAIADAGLTVADIDGLATYPGGMTGPGLGRLLRAGNADRPGRAPAVVAMAQRRPRRHRRRSRP